MISHDESALLRKFKCTDCDKAFKFKHHLKVNKIEMKRVEKTFKGVNFNELFFNLFLGAFENPFG